MADPVLTLAWLVLAHLLADFVFQTDGIAFAKAAHGRRGWYGLAAHGAVVGVLLLPFVAAFGGPGAILLVVVTVSHVVVDRVKIVLTRRAGARAMRAERRGHEAPVSGILGAGWTPAPAALFVADQLVHLGIAAVAWAVWLAGAPLTGGWVALVDALVAAWDPATVHDVALVTAVLASLAVANIRGAAFFVEALVHPRQAAAAMVGGTSAAGATRSAASTAGSTGRGGETATAAAAPPVDGPGRVPGSDIPPPRTITTTVVTRAPSPERVGATIGALERILIVIFILTSNQVAIGFVIAAKTLARFKQLDDRDFAEYYLLGTLASVSVAIVTGLVAAAALG